MSHSFKFIGRLLQKAYSARQNLSRLDKLRAEHPSCNILSSYLYNVSIREHVAILERTYLEQVNIGSYSYVSNDSHLINVDINNFCSIGPHVQIGLAPHPSRCFVSTYPAFYTPQNNGCPSSFREDKVFDDFIAKTTIANDVWIGSNAIIPGGINISNGAIIAAGSVVVKNVPPYAIVGGNPAQVIRYRFSDEHIETLLASEWWDWPIEKIRNNVDNFSDINKFKSSFHL